MKVKRWAIPVLVALCLPATAAPPKRSEARMYRSWTVSQCLAQAQDATAAGADARASAGGYLELGRLPSEAYEDALALAKAQLEVPYVAMEGGTLHVMRCLDLYESEEMNALVRRHVPRRWRR